MKGSPFFLLCFCIWDIRGAVKKITEFFDITFWCTMSWQRPERVLLVFSICKFCRGSRATSGRRAQAGHWFLLHENTPIRTSLVVQQFLPVPNCHTLRISLRVTFGFSLLRKWGSRDTLRNHARHQMECD
jgi:hypothetical protein